jgi:hypothetical protein
MLLPRASSSTIRMAFIASLNSGPGRRRELPDDLHPLRLTNLRWRGFCRQGLLKHMPGHGARDGYPS